MDKYEEFKQLIEKGKEWFRQFDKNKVVRLVSHLDADGITACAIMIKVLNQEKMRYSVSIVRQLTRTVLLELSREDYEQYVFTDMGSGQVSNIKQLLEGKKVLILDHHVPEKAEAGENVLHVNPHLAGISGDKEISGAGVTYFFAKAVNEKNKDMAHIALVGAIGDMQENKGFLLLNNEILEDAVAAGKIIVGQGLRLFGAQTKPVHKVLEYCTDPYIPGVTGRESGAVQFLQELGINPKNSKGWKKIMHLTEQEMKKLVAGIVMRKLGDENPEDVLGNVYVLTDEEKGSPTRDAREYSTLLNACGRLGKASFGIGTCLGDKRIKEKAIQNLQGYKREVIDAINWYEKNKKESDKIIPGEGYLIINAQDEILSTIVGTLASIISRSEVKDGTLILSMAQLIDNTTKCSLRVAGRLRRGMNLKNIIGKIVAEAGGEYGGHTHAAGAIIPTDGENKFIKVAKLVLKKCAMEEVIV